MVGKKDENRSYFSVGRGRRNKNLKIIIPIVVAVVVIAAVILSSTPGAPSVSNKMVLHNHVTLNVTTNGQPQVAQKI